MLSAAHNVMNGPLDEFADGFGVRVRTADPASSERLELLRFSDSLVASQSFEFMLRERASRLANFRHGYYSRVRRVDRLDAGATLGLVSETPQGARLIRILQVAQASGLELDINAALCLVRQLVPAVAMLHQNARDVSHGALGPERILITPNARVVIVEYVLGAAIEQLGYNRERLWKELRVAAPSSAGAPRINHRTDVMQLGMVALALVVGRPLEDDDLKYVGDLVASATESSSGGREPISEPLRRWLSRALQLDSRSSFESALEAQLALDDVLSGEGGYIAAPVALETFLARYEDYAAEIAARPAPPPSPAESPLAPKAAAFAPPSSESASKAKAHSPVSTESASASKVAAPRPVQPTQDDQPDSVPPERAIEIAPIAAATAPAPERRMTKSGSRPAAFAPMAAESASAAKAPAPTTTESAPAPEVEPDDDSLRKLFLGAGPAAPMGVPAYWRMAALALAVVAVAEGGLIGWKFRQSLSILSASDGTLKLDSKPQGAQVKIDGQVKGATPLIVSLSAGTHVMEMSTGGEPRVIPITVDAGQTLGQYVELAGTPVMGRLSVSSTPVGATILIDGQPRGTTPADLSDVAAGDHELILDLNGARTRQPVTVTAGTTTAVAVKLDAAGATGAPVAAAPTTGGLRVNVPFEMQVFEGETLLGVTTTRLALPPGPHDLRIVSETLAFETKAHAEIFVGKTTRVPVTLPKGTMALNATPWAEVWIDGEKVGETPIGNLAVTIGPHEIVFKNPDLGEQHHAATVTAAAPVRLSVDLTKPQP